MITYRKAVVEDAEKLAEMRGAFLKEMNNVRSEEERTVIEKACLDYFRQAICDDAFLSWVAIDNEEIVATSGLSFSVVPPLFGVPDGRVAYIMNMYTCPSYRNRGIATTLFSRIVDEAKHLGYKKITLKATDMGKPLYEKYGFRDVSGEMDFFT